MREFGQIVASLTGLPGHKVEGCVRLLNEGNTVPFIARYRKEITGTLDEVQIRQVAEALTLVKELTKRKETILSTIDGLGKLTDELRRQIESCWDKRKLEDLYLPYKPQKNTRADAARKAGLQPLADIILGRQACRGNKFEVASGFVNVQVGIKSADEALAGARDIVAEEVCNDSQVRSTVRDWAQKWARIATKKKTGVDEDASVFRDYFDHEEGLGRIAPHRFLAIQRGESEGALSVRIKVDDERGLGLAKKFHFDCVPPIFKGEYHDAVDDGWKRLMRPAIRRELLAMTKEWADRSSVGVFEQNLRALLMEPPARGKRTLAVDPGFRNGCKLACVDGTGKVLTSTTIYPHPPQLRRTESGAAIQALVQRHSIDVIAVGDGTAHRESMALLSDLQLPSSVEVTAVREAGASVYSASPLATQELPDMDVSLRGAVSIARRFQDPLAELVKIDPKSLGVGQYQHDVDQGLLAAGLDAVVEECVNRVGVELNTASIPLLARVAGLGPGLAARIVAHRERQGAFSSRKEVMDVSGLGQAKFTQCAGFLRIVGGREPLDSTGIHPESYGLVRTLGARLKVPVRDLLANREAVAEARKDLATAGGASGETMADILAELEKPGRDPRGQRESFSFAEGIDSPDDLVPGMSLPGRVSSITAFGAFVDIGVHRDGLVHISQLADRRVNSAFDVVQPRQIVRVKVLDVDRKRGRISLTMKPSEVDSS